MDYSDIKKYQEGRLSTSEASEMFEKYLKELNGLIWKIIRTKVKFPCPCSEEQLYNAGFEGLHKAILNFKTDSGFKLSTYAYNKIWSAVIEEAKENGNHKHEEIDDSFIFQDTYEWVDIEKLMSNLNKREKEIAEQHIIDGKTIVEISKELGLTKQRVHNIKKNAVNKMKGKL